METHRGGEEGGHARLGELAGDEIKTRSKSLLVTLT